MVLDLYFENYARQFENLDRPFWNYEDGCVLTALQAMYEATGNEIYKESARIFMERYILEDGSIRYYEQEEYSLDHIPSGRILFFLYKEIGGNRYRIAMEALMQQLRLQPRLEVGSFWHKKIYPYQLWLDGVYMASPFYLLYEKNFNHGKNYDDILLQFSNARTYLFDQERHLYYHAWDEQRCQFWTDRKSGLSANFWSRAMGWFVMALADCYEIFPEEEIEKREHLSQLWQEALNGILEYQDKESGMFFQLTALSEETGNYIETSATAMIAYSLMKGCRLAVFSQDYFKIALQIWCGLETRSIRMSNGHPHIDGICAGAGLGPADRSHRDGSIAYYLSELVVSDEQKGVASVMLAYSELLKLRKNINDWTELFPVPLNDVHLLRHG